VELLREAEGRNLIRPDALAMIEGVLEVSELRARDVMIPRSQMVVVHKDEALEVIVPRAIDSAHSRLPVIGDDRGEVVGILLAKDLLSYCFWPKKNRFRLRDLMRPAVVVPESRRLDMMLRDFRSSRNHMAIVVDEYGVVSGLVTIEDVLEQIVGEIEDEHDVEDDAFLVQRGDGEFTVKALMPIEEFNEYFQCEISDEEFGTVGGLVLHALGYVPEKGEELVYQRFRFQVLRADKRRVHLLRVSRLQDSADRRG
jgi:magnesium and cobalt transporter